MKYFLILWVCSAINASCIVPPITTPETYNSHNECVSAGYVQGYNVFKAIDPKVAEQQRLFNSIYISNPTVIYHQRCTILAV
jgi:hypothetical protein